MEEFHRMKLRLYPDESVYSICARYYLYSGHFTRLAKIKRNNKLYLSLQNAFYRQWQVLVIQAHRKIARFLPILC